MASELSNLLNTMKTNSSSGSSGVYPTHTTPVQNSPCIDLTGNDCPPYVDSNSSFITPADFIDDFQPWEPFNKTRITENLPESEAEGGGGENTALVLLFSAIFTIVYLAFGFFCCWCYWVHIRSKMDISGGAFVEIPLQEVAGRQEEERAEEGEAGEAAAEGEEGGDAEGGTDEGTETQKKKKVVIQAPHDNEFLETKCC